MSTKTLFQLPELPYSTDALEPIISAQTVGFHWGKHLQTYIDNLNKLKEDSEFENASLEQIICEADGAIFNNAAQCWNHIFYFASFAPLPKGEPTGALREAIDRDFGSLEEFKALFESKGAALFGSGWVWLCKNEKGALSIQQKGNAENPLSDGLQPLFVADVWEHAYYLDYQNRRGEHLNRIWEIVDWQIIEGRF